jgi:hypothetical protein
MYSIARHNDGLLGRQEHICCTFHVTGMGQC